jgi:hypothetical protein
MNFVFCILFLNEMQFIEGMKNLRPNTNKNQLFEEGFQEF